MCSVLTTIIIIIIICTVFMHWNVIDALQSSWFMCHVESSHHFILVLLGVVDGHKASHYNSKDLHKQTTREISIITFSKSCCNDKLAGI